MYFDREDNLRHFNLWYQYNLLTEESERDAHNDEYLIIFNFPDGDFTIKKGDLKELAKQEMMNLKNKQ